MRDQDGKETPKVEEKTQQTGQPVKVETREFTAELVNSIISGSMAHKGELQRYMASQFELSPKSTSLRLKGCRSTK